MNLFEQKVSTDKLHPNYISMMEKIPKKDREILNEWIDGFPDRDNKFVKEFQTTFNSSFWEIYLYKLFKDLGFEFDWSHSRPDFILKHEKTDFIVEATISSNAQDEKPEWEKEDDLIKRYDGYLEGMNERNKYSIIRLSNSFTNKFRKYKDSYQTLAHVKNKPFILAISPMEQPLHYHQYDRPIMALLYDFYLDEEEYLKNQEKFPDGLRDKRLYSVEKPNGSEIELGFFLDDRASEISAVLFNPLATWSKIQCMKKNKMGVFTHTWVTPDSQMHQTTNEKELIEDGLFIFHNPYAKYPLDKNIFNRDRISQVFMDKDTLFIERNYGSKHLTNRVAFEIILKKEIGKKW